MELRWTHTLWIGVLSIMVAAPVVAQRVIDLPVAISRPHSEPEVIITGDDSIRVRSLSDGQLAGGVALGVGGGLMVAMVGARIGVAVAGNCRGEDCVLGSALLGFAIGESLGVAVGTHVGARGHGNLALESLTSVAIATVGIGVALLHTQSAGAAAPIALALVPVGQIIAVLFMEARE